MSEEKFARETGKLNLSARVKAELMLLFYAAKDIAIKILAFLKRHKEFIEAMLLGALVALLLTAIPWLGYFLALCSLVTAAALGILAEIRSHFEEFFEMPITA